MIQYFDKATALRRVLFFLFFIACLTPYVTPPLALAMGFFFAFFIGHPFIEKNNAATNYLLKFSVVGLGFGMNLSSAVNAGKSGLVFTVASILLTIALGAAIGKWMRIPGKTSHLVASGTAICGGSAIAAIAPIVDASEKEMSVALGTVFLLNSVALIVFPPVGSFFHLTQSQFGLWAAIAIHDTSSVVGAASAYGSEALQTAVTIKLARALWIIPVAMATGFFFKSGNKKIKIPYFIGFFVLAIIINSCFDLPAVMTSSIVHASRIGLTATLFLVGCGLSLEKIKSVGWKPLALGILLWISISVLSLTVICNT